VPDSEPDLLALSRGTITAPAGCGKTQLIANALVRHGPPKPILVLTHTNAGVVALRTRLDRAGVPSSAYRLATIDGWALRLLSLFPKRSGVDPAALRLTNPRNDYPIIRKLAAILMRDGHVLDVVRASFSRLIVDEYQDCSTLQHALIHFTAPALPTVALGDPMQAIFGWQGNELADWEKHVKASFPAAGELQTPWRWRNAGTEALGQWLLDARRRLQAGQSVDLTSAPREVEWVELDGSEDMARQLKAGQVIAPTKDGAVLIIGRSTQPQQQRDFASRTPGAVTVEAVDLRDLVDFARRLDFGRPDALQQVVDFASSVMTNVGAANFLGRIAVLERGTQRNAASDAEVAALQFKSNPSPANAVNLLVEIGKQSGVRPHRPVVLRACIKALQSCDGTEENSFLNSVVRAREQNRLVGRPLPRRAVGSTLLLKGLEADVAVILDASDLDAKNLYVAMTRAARRLVICAPKSMLCG
jgi:superfamily I DNA/RNA helicase